MSKPKVSMLLGGHNNLPINKDLGVPISEYQNLHYGIYEIKDDSEFIALRQVFNNKEDAQFFLDKLNNKNYVICPIKMLDKEWFFDNGDRTIAEHSFSEK